MPEGMETGLYDVFDSGGGEAARAGKSKEKALPFSGWLSMVISPPMARA